MCVTAGSRAWGGGERIAAALPNASLLMIPDCGHLPHLKHPEVFNAAVLEMLKLIGQPA